MLGRVLFCVLHRHHLIAMRTNSTEFILEFRFVLLFRVYISRNTFYHINSPTRVHNGSKGIHRFLFCLIDSLRMPFMTFYSPSLSRTPTESIIYDSPLLH